MRGILFLAAMIVAPCFAEDEGFCLDDRCIHMNLLQLGIASSAHASPGDDKQLLDLFYMWSAFRDDVNGLYCDALLFGDSNACGISNNRYSAASAGMGLVAEVVFAQLGLQTRTVASQRVMQTITSLVDFWPKANVSGFLVHFTDRHANLLGEYSTIDSAIAVLGSLFAGKYFGGEVQAAAQTLAKIPAWTSAIQATWPKTPPTSNNSTVPDSCLGAISWGFNSGKYADWYRQQFASQMLYFTGVSLDQGTFQDFQRLYTCGNLNAWQCNAVGLGFPDDCSNPPCWTCGLDSGIAMVSDNHGVMSDLTQPYNEYYLVAYLAQNKNIAGTTSTAVDLTTAQSYFELFFGTSQAPKGNGQFPAAPTYHGYNLLSDGSSVPSSFIPQFCKFLSRSFSKSPFYSQLSASFMKADRAFWELSLNSSSMLDGFPVQGQVWGCGAGSTPTGYQATSVTNNPTLSFSAPIMAGFLKVDSTFTVNITAQLSYLYNNNICTYRKALPSGKTVKVLWMCSMSQPGWRASAVDSIDFSTMVLGYAQRYLPDAFYESYAV